MTPSPLSGAPPAGRSSSGCAPPSSPRRSTRSARTAVSRRAINERLRELSLLIAARHFDAQYSWNAHHKKAIEAGVSAESVKELAGNEVPRFAHADEQLLYALATQILRDHFVDQETFDAALAEWGEAGLVDIIGCLGNFSMLAMLLNTFQVDLKAGDPEPFPDVRGFAKVSDPRG